ncbi:unnamed protein product [Rotaria sp. Silwood2]|nr:unnamed protein product [Rotaria sp. Silwood2]CAF2995230.1 unnamed protein product [Rotaria sp. Silwood2]CAF3158182.1 unnamed protein product [Rotaria sp. Silwood2]CAF4046879.1 unnamed protein product [Rotaria sp. Silwood2]CAF4312218.1 unnamed protein product [Rotaria sp. Silwood2]
MSYNQSISTLHHSPYSIRKKQINFHHNYYIIEQKNNFQSIGDTLFVHDLFEQVIVQPSTNINYNDYFYMIYLLLLTIFYIYYIRIIFQEKTNLLDDNELYHYFDNYERKIPLLLWFRKGYRLC